MSALQPMTAVFQPTETPLKCLELYHQTVVPVRGSFPPHLCTMGCVACVISPLCFTATATSELPLRFAHTSRYVLHLRSACIPGVSVSDPAPARFAGNRMIHRLSKWQTGGGLRSCSRVQHVDCRGLQGYDHRVCTDLLAHRDKHTQHTLSAVCSAT